MNISFNTGCLTDNLDNMKSMWLVLGADKGYSVRLWNRCRGREIDNITKLPSHYKKPNSVRYKGHTLDIRWIA